ncbi:PREDICTED: facilitated trehalose transporter Tret1-like isoform X2 [Ceratosolen solmsi marchali]|uniref:Facilitated trehalose transporter Tret1-like isoform X2 n=1 Tax=Ceratosolen solmsi marchali TaxID=326594 RepID=A0AAJ6YSM7_9HYME|nr:PREDICTED: facilitated trehalose transporter Tret1-like isoform X2 [Ceratosolen solmsi marchali]
MQGSRNYKTFCNISELNSNTLATQQNSIILGAKKAALVHQKYNAGTQSITNITNKNQEKKMKKIQGSPYRQILAAFVAQLGTINTGMTFGFPAIALPQLKDGNGTININLNEASWIASFSAIGTPIGCFFSGYMMDMLGRKLSLIVTEVPALLGLGSGMVGAPARVYTSEVTQPHLRGMLTAIASVGVSTGVLIEYALGAIISWNVCASISAIIPATALVLMFLFPETPSYLISINKPEEARESLKKFRSTSYDLNEEMNTLINFSNKNNLKKLTGFYEIVVALVQPNALKPFLLLFLYFLIYQWTGTNAVTFYAVDIVAISGIQLNKYFVTVFFGVIRLISTIAACIACRRYGRRPMTLISSIGCGITMIGLGIYIWLKEYLVNYSWIPILCITGYSIACTLGFLVIPWIMIGEIYPVQIRGIIGGLTTMFAHSFVFSVVKTYPLLATLITQHGTFLLYGCISLIGTIYFYIYLPETKNKSLQEIEDFFSGRNNDLKTGKINIKPNFLQVRKGQVLP